LSLGSRPTEARYQLRDDTVNAIVDHKIHEQGPRARIGAEFCRGD
jgi:hypothetical protein